MINLFRKQTELPVEPAPVAVVSTDRGIADFDRELEALSRQYQQLWGRIEQCKMERAFELARLAKLEARSTPAPVVHEARWNDRGHCCNNFDMEELIR